MRSAASSARYTENEYSPSSKLPNGVSSPSMDGPATMQHALRRDEADAPSRDDGIEQPVVQAADDQELQDQPDEPRGEGAA